MLAQPLPVALRGFAKRTLRIRRTSRSFRVQPDDFVLASGPSSYPRSRQDQSFCLWKQQNERLIGDRRRTCLSRALIMRGSG